MNLSFLQQFKDLKSLFFRENKIQGNAIYFIFLFFILSLIHGYHILLIEGGPLFSRIFFLIYAILESFIEVGLFMVIALAIQERFAKVYSYFFISLTLFVFLLHLLDFPMVRLMDMSVWYAIDFISQETADNVIEMVYASNVSLFAWALGLIVGFILLFMGLLFYHFSNKLLQRKPFYTTYRSFGQILGAAALFLAFFDISTARFTISADNLQFQKALPWKTTLFPPRDPYFVLPGPIKKPQDELDVIARLASRPITAKTTPDIFLFVVESLREDFITHETAPHIDQFKKENISLESSYSNANHTVNSWFSLFHSKLPFYWAKMREQNWRSGGLPLKIFKKMGYKIHVYSSARLGYYRMDDLIFGEAHHLADSFYFFPHEEIVPAHVRDEKTIEELLEDLPSIDDQKGHLYIIFLDSTHFDYSWPPTYSLPFTPIIDEVNYFQAALSKSCLEKIKNRYRNAIHYIDSLFGKFVASLKTAERYQDSWIIMTGDHGEEFFEQGHLFHASSLNKQQTSVPIYYKLNKEAPPCPITSHMDIFPTLFDVLVGDDFSPEFLEGESIYRREKCPYVYSARYNASRSPYEFSIQNGSYRLVARLSNERNIFKAKELRILSIKNSSDEVVPLTPGLIQEQFGEAIREMCAP